MSAYRLLVAAYGKRVTAPTTWGRRLRPLPYRPMWTVWRPTHAEALSDVTTRTAGSRP